MILSCANGSQLIHLFALQVNCLNKYPKHYIEMRRITQILSAAFNYKCSRNAKIYFHERNALPEPRPNPPPFKNIWAEQADKLSLQRAHTDACTSSASSLSLSVRRWPVWEDSMSYKKQSTFTHRDLHFKWGICNSHTLILTYASVYSSGYPPTKSSPTILQLILSWIAQCGLSS